MINIEANNCLFEDPCALLNTMKKQDCMSRFTVNLPEQCSEIETTFIVKQIYDEVTELVISLGLAEDIADGLRDLYSLSVENLESIMKKVEDSAFLAFFNILRKQIPETTDWLLNNQNFALNADEKKNLDHQNLSIPNFLLEGIDLSDMSPEDAAIFNLISQRATNVFAGVQTNHNLDDKFFSKENQCSKAQDIRIWMQKNKDKLININSLELSHKCALVPQEIGDLLNLTRLSIADIPRTQLPSEIGKLTNLTDIWICNTRRESRFFSAFEASGKQESSLNLQSTTGLKELLPEISCLTKLTKLTIEGYQLMQLPLGISTLVNLKTLCLSGNKLSSLTSGFWKLTNLEDLRLNENELSMLPVGIGELTNLKQLCLDFNELTEFPEDFFQLKSLESLNISNNKFKEVPHELFKMTQLKSLYLDDSLVKDRPIIGSMQWDMLIVGAASYAIPGKWGTFRI